MALNSPGVEVKVIDESFYVPAEPGTRPLLIVSTKENKRNASGTGIAVGTLKANAGKPYLLTSQRDLSDIFGTPMFYTDSSQNPIHGGELNEYGLQAAYSYLGVSNSAYVVRSDLDLGQLVPSTTAPHSNPLDGQYWLDTVNTHFGIFEWNGDNPKAKGGQKFTNKIPVVITDPTQVDEANGKSPLGSIGKIGDYAVVSVTSVNTMYYKNASGEWVIIGSDDWLRSIPTVQSSKANPSLVEGDSLFIGTNLLNTDYEVEVVVPATNNISGLAEAINTAGIVGVTANYNPATGKLEIYGSSAITNIRILKGEGNLIDSTLTHNDLGLLPGTFWLPALSIQSHTNVPRYKISDPNRRPTGSIWIKTTNVNLGAHWIVKAWDSAIKDWKLVEAPVYANNQAALYGLDRAGGGVNIPTGSLYVHFNVDEGTSPIATFTLYRRENPAPTTLTSKVITETSFINGIEYIFNMSETTIGSANLSAHVPVRFVGTHTTGDANSIASAVNALGLDHIVASVNTRNQVVIKHEKGGDLRLKGELAVSAITGISIVGDGSYEQVASSTIGSGSGAKFNVTKTTDSTSYSGFTRITLDAENPGSGYVAGDQITIPGSYLGGADGTNDLTFTFVNSLDVMGYSPYDYVNHTGTLNLYTAPLDDMDNDYVVTNWKQLKVKASNTVPSEIPLDGTLWYNPILDNVDIMIHNGNTWVGYQDPTSPYWTEDPYFKTDPNGPLVTATKPTTQSDGTDLVNGDIWIDSGDTENYPAMYKFDVYNRKWVAVDNTDQTTEDGVLFADARAGVSGGVLETMTLPGDNIQDMLYSNFLDFDAPDPDLYPRGMLLFNTRRSGNNVKRFVKNYIDNNADNIRTNNESQLTYYPHRWVNESGIAADGHGLFGRFAQRKVVVKHLKSLVDTNQLLREQEIRTFNIIACPGYVELIANMVNLNIDRKQTAFVIGDTPFRLPNDATSINDWGTNARHAVDNGEQGLVTYDEYLGVYYPSGYTTDNSGNNIVVPASHMVLRSIALSDGVSYPWFAPAGTRRGKVSNATSVGYVDARTHEWQSIALNEGQRDTLYSVAINPITFLTGAGIVIFGQKTRAANASALDRVNVARLVVYLRGQLTKLAKPYIFEPNDKITRDELKSAAESIMLELVGQRGIYDYLVVCDDSNNTPSRIDRNELYLDIAIEPVKAVEFIYIPLRLKNTGEIAGLGK